MLRRDSLVKTTGGSSSDFVPSSMFNLEVADYAGRGRPPAPSYAFRGLISSRLRKLPSTFLLWRTTLEVANYDGQDGWRGQFFNGMAQYGQVSC